MAHRISMWLDDYLAHTDLIQLVQDTWKYLLALAVLALATRYVLQRRRRQP